MGDEEFDIALDANSAVRGGVPVGRNVLRQGAIFLPQNSLCETQIRVRFRTSDHARRGADLPPHPRPEIRWRKHNRHRTQFKGA